MEVYSRSPREMKTGLGTEVLNHSSVLLPCVLVGMSSCGSLCPSGLQMFLSAEGAEEESGMILHV